MCAASEKARWGHTLDPCESCGDWSSCEDTGDCIAPVRDKNILDRIQRGTERDSMEAFAELYTTYEPVVRTQLRRKGLRGSNLDEVVADTLIFVTNKILTFKWEGITLDRWIKSIAKNKAKEYWRECERLNQREVPLDALDEDPEENATTLVESKEYEEFSARRGRDLQGEEEDKALQEERDRIVWEAVKQLSPREQQVIICRYFWNFDTFEEIAEELGTSEGAARVAHHRALKKLRENPDLESFNLPSDSDIPSSDESRQDEEPAAKSGSDNDGEEQEPPIDDLIQ